MSDNPEALTYSIDACDEAFVRDFCPYKGSPDPFVVWRAAWKSALAQQAATPTDAVAAFEESMRQTWRMIDPLHPAGQPGSYARGQDNGIAAALKTVRENFERLLSARQAATPAPAGEPLLLGRWHHGEGHLCSGTLRVARADFDTNPTAEFRDKVLDWMVETLNAELRRAAASPATPAPAGWKLVPEEPTEAMLRASVKSHEGPAVYKVLSDGGLRTLEQESRDAYLAMIAAAPPATPAAQPHTDAETAYAAMAEHLNCPACGGSGHIDDARDGWIPVSARLPSYESAENGERVLVLTLHDDFAGVQVHDIPASDFYLTAGPDDDEPGTEVTRVATHWRPRVLPWSAA